MFFEEKDERVRFIRTAILRCTKIIEDGWEDEDFNYIGRDLRKIFFSLEERVGFPKDLEVEKKISELKNRFGPGQRGLENLKNHLLVIEREWIGRLKGGR